MTESREKREQEQPEQQTTPEGQIAVALLTGSGVASVAPALLLAVPPPVFILPGGIPLAAEIAEEVARFVLSVPLDIPADIPDTGILREAALNAVVYRAAYALAATRRVAAVVLGEEEGGDHRAALKAALVREKTYFAAHREVTRRRMAAARATEAMMELHGPVLIWRHGATRTPDEPRPAHRAADGRAFDLRRGIPTSTGALPGVLPNCSCAWAAPRGGERMMI